MLQHFYEPEKRYKEKERPYKTKEGEAVFSRGELKIANTSQSEKSKVACGARISIYGSWMCISSFREWRMMNRRKNTTQFGIWQ